MSQLKSWLVFLLCSKSNIDRSQRAVSAYIIHNSALGKFSIFEVDKFLQKLMRLEQCQASWDLANKQQKLGLVWKMKENQPSYNEYLYTPFLPYLFFCFEHKYCSQCISSYSVPKSQWLLYSNCLKICVQVEQDSQQLLYSNCLKI